jgi:hypothetical protein
VLRFLLLPFVLISLAQSRGNPFFPTEGIKDLPVSSNQTKSFIPLQRIALNLPGSARIVKEVTVRYQNLDGSIDSKSILLDHSVDWHLPIFISQTFTANETDNPSTDETPEKKYKKIVDFGEAVFYHSGNRMKIITADKLIRHFMVIKPHRIVMDFKRVTDFRSKTKELPGKPYKKIRMGNHNGYYRIVIELDGQYRYTLTHEKESVILTCY